jgi:ribosomal protein L6P/L9E
MDSKKILTTGPRGPTTGPLANDVILKAGDDDFTKMLQVNKAQRNERFIGTIQHSLCG